MEYIVEYCCPRIGYVKGLALKCAKQHSSHEVVKSFGIPNTWVRVR
jgi:hypothetical protein